MPSHLSILYIVIFFLVLGPELIHLLFGAVIEVTLWVAGFLTITFAVILILAVVGYFGDHVAQLIGYYAAHVINQGISFVVLFIVLPLLYFDSLGGFRKTRSIFSHTQTKTVTPIVTANTPEPSIPIQVTTPYSMVWRGGK